MGGQVLNYFGENIGLYGTSMWAMVRLMSAGRDGATKPRGAEGSKICLPKLTLNCLQDF